MRTSWDEIWRFETPRFLVIAEATDCPDDPADSFERSDDIEAVRSGNVAWFDARVRVVLKDGDIEIGSDYLGACAYDDPADLFRDHARGTRRLRDLRGRTDSKSRREHKALRIELANRAAINPPCVYCYYGPEMVQIALRNARETLATLRATVADIRAV